MPILQAFKEFPNIETKNLVLRRIVQSDTAALYTILSDPTTVEFYDDDAFTDVSQAWQQINTWEKGYQDRWCIRWGITKKGEENTLIGSCGFYGIHYFYQKASVGYELNRKCWRRGIMTETLEAIVEYGFMQMELNRIDALVMPENIASMKLLERLGFRQEGLLKQFEQWGSKGFVDLNMVALLRRDYQE